MFLRSPKPSGELFFGMTVTYSIFHFRGQSEVLTISLKIEVRGMAKKSANFVTKSGKRSPDTMDFGLRKRRTRPATSCNRSGFMWRSVVRGIWSAVSGYEDSDEDEEEEDEEDAANIRWRNIPSNLVP